MNILTQKKLLSYINDKLDPNIALKKSKGEVFTPLCIISTILSKFPDEVWMNPSLRWLDPATGIGNYPIIIYYKLMNGLSTWEPDEEKRRKHILENMLYMIEINPTNISIISDIFCHNLYTLHIYNTSFLTFNDDIGFDIIVGNPPYNERGTGRTTGSRQPYWPKFIDKSLHLLNKDGYLSFIHPVGWRKPYSNTMQTNIGKYLLQYVTKGSLIYINMSDKIIPHFPEVDYYIYQNKQNQSTTIDSTYNNIHGSYKSVNLKNIITNDLSMLPSFYNKISHSIFTKLFSKYNDNPLFSIMYDGHFKPDKKMIKREKKGIPYTFIHKDNTYVEIYEEKSYNYKMKRLQEFKDGSYKSKMKDREDLLNYFHKPKIIMSFSGSQPLCSLNPVYYDKVIGSSNQTMYLLVKDKIEASKYIHFFKSQLITFLVKLTQYSPPPRNKNDHKILNYIQIPTLPENPTNEDIFNYYKLTKKEITLITRIQS